MATTNPFAIPTASTKTPNMGVGTGNFPTDLGKPQTATQAQPGSGAPGATFSPALAPKPQQMSTQAQPGSGAAGATFSPALAPKQPEIQTPDTIQQQQQQLSGQPAPMDLQKQMDQQRVMDLQKQLSGLPPTDLMPVIGGLPPQMDQQQQMPPPGSVGQFEQQIKTNPVYLRLAAFDKEMQAIHAAGGQPTPEQKAKMDELLAQYEADPAITASRANYNALMRQQAMTPMPVEQPRMGVGQGNFPVPPQQQQQNAQRQEQQNARRQEQEAKAQAQLMRQQQRQVALRQEREARQAAQQAARVPRATTRAPNAA